MFLPENVILVKSYLAVEHGDCYGKKMYEDKGNIAKSNIILDEYYHYFEGHFKGIRVIECLSDSLYFTNNRYEYGRFPWHLNDEINYWIADSINEMLT